jgi:hypothetical protein
MAPRVGDHEKTRSDVIDVQDDLIRSVADDRNIAAGKLWFFT